MITTGLKTTIARDFWPCASLLSLFLACAPSESLESAIARNTCPPEACGLNGPRLAEHTLGELDIDGRPGSHGFAIVDFVARDGRSLALDIVSAGFVGRDRATGKIVDVDDIQLFYRGKETSFLKR